MPSSRGSSWSRDRTKVSCIAGGFFTVWATREALADYIYKFSYYLHLYFILQLQKCCLAYLFGLPTKSCINRFRDSGREGVAEDEMTGRHHWLNAQNSEQTLGNGEGRGRLECCSPWGGKEADTTYHWITTTDSQCILLLKGRMSCNAGQKQEKHVKGY